MANPLSKTQERVLKTIISFIEQNGFPPTIREIMTLMGYASVNNVQRILTILEQKGYIRRNYRGTARSIEVIQKQVTKSNKEKTLPILGNVAAGLPIFAEQNIEGYITINPEIMGFDGDFILRIKGDSMINANINDNDLVVVKQTNFPNNGDIIVGLLDEDATVKRFFLKNNLIQLIPENPNYQPITISKNDMYFKVLGKIQAVITSLAKKGT